MKRKKIDIKAIVAENRALHERLQNVEETLRAVQRGEVDGIVISTPEGEQLFTLSGVEKPYRLLIEEMKEGAVMLSENNTVLYCNSGFADIIKQPLDKIIGTNIQNVIAATHKAVFRELLAFGRRGEGAKTGEVSFQNADKTLVPTHVSVNSLQKDDVKTTFLVITDLTHHMQEDVKRYTANLEIEISQRRKAEEDLRRRQAEIQTLFENIPAGLVLFDAKNPYTVLAHNKHYQELFDEPFRSKGMVGLNIYEYAPEVEASGVKAVFDEIVRTQNPKRFLEFPYKSNPPNETWFDWYMAPILLDGRVVALVSMSLDVTDRHMAEEALSNRNKELEVLQMKLEGKASEVEEYATHLEELAQERLVKLKDAERLAAIGATAGMVGHDIRNPLQAISGDIYLALKDLGDLPESEQKQSIRESLDGIGKSVDYINKIVQDLQDFARPVSPIPDEVNLRSLCEDALLQNPMRGNIKATCRVDRDVEQIIADKELLKRVVNNLVSNALQAMPNGGKLSINAHREGKDAVIEVKDTGEGIPEDVKPRLFTPLFTTKSKGQGFGLAVVKRVMEAMKGTVSFESEAGKGTKFIVRLPPPKAERGTGVYDK